MQLFTRTSRGVTLTEAGSALLIDARGIQTLVAQAADRAKRAGRGEIGTLDIGIFGSAVIELVPRLLANFTAAHRDVAVVLHHAPKTQQIEAVRDGRVLIAFDRDLPREPDLVVELVAREAILVATHARNPLATLDAIDIARLLDEPMIVGAGRGDPIWDAIRRHGFVPRVAHAVGDVPTAVALVAGGMGSTLVPASTGYLRLPNLVYRPLRGVRSRITFECCYRKGDKPPVLTALLAVVAEFRRTEEQRIA